MEDRLLKLLDTEQLSSSRFADVIGVQRSSVSHILTGRNKPSFDFLQKTLKAFPMLNADWLILGEGEMYEGEHGPGGGNLFDLPAPSSMHRGADSVQDGAEKSSSGSTSTLQESNISDDSSGESENFHQEGDASGYAVEPEWGSHGQQGHSPSGQAIQNQGKGSKNTQASPQTQQAQYGERAQQTQGTQHEEAAQQTQDSRQTQAHDTSLSASPSVSIKRVRRVILFYDDNSFEAYEQA